MTADNPLDLHGTPVLTCPPEMSLSDANDALDLIGQALGCGAEAVVVPVEQLAPEFFALRTRLAGEVTQKFVNYRLRLVILGDIASQLSESAALRAFVAEANRGGPLWFVTSMADLESRLKRSAR